MWVIQGWEMSPAIHSVLSWVGFSLWVLAGLLFCFATYENVSAVMHTRSGIRRKNAKSIRYIPIIPPTSYEDPADWPDSVTPFGWVRQEASGSELHSGPGMPPDVAAD